MSKRHDHLAAYVEGWRTMDAELVLSALADGFVFDDPAHGEPVTKSTMAGFMASWDERTRALSGSWRYENSDEVVEDRDGVLLRWKWWRFAGTDIQGSALTKTGDDGMLSERIAYYPVPPAWTERTAVDTASRRHETGLLVRDALLSWQTWSPSAERACEPRYKTFFSAGETPTSGLVQGVLEFPPGARSLAHRHSPVETYYVLAGSGVGLISDATLPIGPGDAVFVPGGAVHSFENNGPDTLRVLWTLNCDGVDDIDFTFVE